MIEISAGATLRPGRPTVAPVNYSPVGYSRNLFVVLRVVLAVGGGAAGVKGDTAKWLVRSTPQPQLSSREVSICAGVPAFRDNANYLAEM